MIRVAICDDDISFTGSIEEQLHTLTSSLSIPLETETFFNGNSLFYLPPLNNLLINSQVTPLSSIFPFLSPMSSVKSSKNRGRKPSISASIFAHFSVSNHNILWLYNPISHYHHNTSSLSPSPHVPPSGSCQTPCRILTHSPGCRDILSRGRALRNRS